MDLPEIKTFIDAMAASGLAELEFSKEGWTLKLVARRQFAPATEAQSRVIPSVPKVATPRKEILSRQAVSSAADQGLTVRAPLAGTVYLQPKPGAPAFVSVGDVVAQGATVCVVEAMKMMNEVRAQRAGRVASISVASGTDVEAGQLLMHIA